MSELEALGQYRTGCNIIDDVTAINVNSGDVPDDNWDDYDFIVIHIFYCLEWILQSNKLIPMSEEVSILGHKGDQ